MSLQVTALNASSTSPSLVREVMDRHVTWGNEEAVHMVNFRVGNVGALYVAAQTAEFRDIVIEVTFTAHDQCIFWAMVPEGVATPTDAPGVMSQTIGGALQRGSSTADARVSLAPYFGVNNTSAVFKGLRTVGHPWQLVVARQKGPAGAGAVVRTKSKVSFC